MSWVAVTLPACRSESVITWMLQFVLHLPKPAVALGRVGRLQAVVEHRAARHETERWIEAVAHAHRRCDELPQIVRVIDAERPSRSDRPSRPGDPSAAPTHRRTQVLVAAEMRRLEREVRADEPAARTTQRIADVRDDARQTTRAQDVRA